MRRLEDLKVRIECEKDLGISRPEIRGQRSEEQAEGGRRRKREDGRTEDKES